MELTQIMNADQTHVAASIDNVEVLIHAVEDLRAQIPDWDELTRREKLQRSRDVEPVRRWETHNVTLEQYHEEIIRGLDPAVENDLEISHLALGNGDSAPSVGDDGLENELFRTTITDIVNRDTEILASTFLTSSMANGDSYYEGAIVGERAEGSDLFVNRLLLDDPEGRLDPKTSQNTATVNITIGQEDQSEVN